MVLVFIVMAAAMFAVLQDTVKEISVNYARVYASNAAYAFGAFFDKEISLVAKAARSGAIVNWFADEDDQEKKDRAHAEMMAVIESLHSDNLYIGIEKTLNEFTVEKGYAVDDIRPFATLDPNYYDDAWYFECIASDKDYVLNVDIDKILNRKRLWVNYKVFQNGVPLGIVCTGMEFSRVAEEYFSKYSDVKIRALIVDGDGVIHVDSLRLGTEDFLLYASDANIKREFSDPKFLDAVESYLNGIEGYFKSADALRIVEMRDGPYRYATIVPIMSTDWSVITLYNSSSLFDKARLIPLLLVMLGVFIIFALINNFMNYELIFMPFEQLTRSLARLKENNVMGCIYGLERNDEVGILANTIQDLFVKGHYDALTGIYNRRFLEENLYRVIMSMSRRPKSLLSVCMVDVDFFKKYNDIYGHNKGDECLKAITESLTKTVTRIDDFVARYGGEEFAVVLPNTDEKGARIIADLLLENVRKLNIPHEKSTVADCVTISLGVTTSYVTHTQSWQDYVKRADEALYVSKQSGRNRYTYISLTDQ
ncbi:MAG: GGDEF domain-containing protein [Synergistaceae bacterium]|nr:GGDEF domain-containing protein [Synergistaceae bacterium]